MNLYQRMLINNATNELTDHKMVQNIFEVKYKINVE